MRPQHTPFNYIITVEYDDKNIDPKHYLQKGYKKAILRATAIKRYNANRRKLLKCGFTVFVTCIEQKGAEVYRVRVEMVAFASTPKKPKL